MIPTDAQIEAEARVRVWDALTDQGKLAWRLDAKTALTAAAEVGPRDLTPQEQQLMHRALRASSVPATEVGPDEKLIERCKRLTKDRSEIESITIERCAKFAENYFEMEYEKGYGEMIADAMREALLKDKP